MLAPPTVQAEAQSASETLFGSPETVIIATGRRESVRTAPAVASVITSEQIRDYGFRDVIEALTLVPGFHVGLSLELQPFISVRGFTDRASNNILFLLDGISVTDLSTGDQMSALGTIPLDMIDRIEITRGPGSSVFAADAFSAVVNIITKRQTSENRLALSAGSWETANGRLLWGTGGENYSVVVGAEGMSTDGYAPWITADRATLIDQTLGLSSSRAPGHAQTGRHKTGVMANVTIGETTGMFRVSEWSNSGTGLGLGGAIDPDGSTSVKTVQGRVTHNLALGEDLSLSLGADVAKFDVSLNDIHWIPPSMLFPNGAVMNSLTGQTSVELLADMRYDGFTNHSIAFGIGHEQSRLRSERADFNYVLTDAGPFPVIPGVSSAEIPELDVTRKIAYAYLQDEWLIAPKWRLTLGARIDDYSDVGTQTSPRAVLVWTPAPEWTAKLLYGEGFRAPMLVETRQLGVPIYQPNEALKPQRLKTSGLFLGYNPSPRLEMGLNLFRHDTVDQIRQQDRGLFVFPENVGNQIGTGAEFEAAWTIDSNWALAGWYAYQYNTDETTDKNIGFSPQHRGFASLQYRRDEWFFNLRGLFVGPRARVAEDLRDDPDPYARFDLLGRYTINRHVSVQLDVRNLLNSNDLEAAPGTALPTDYPLPERSFYTTFMLQF